MSDRGMFSGPVSVSRLLSLRAFTAMAKAQPERWEALEKAGFKVDPYGDIQEAINIRLGGHYIDVGTSAKISKGLVSITCCLCPQSRTPLTYISTDQSQIGFSSSSI
jgi:hypothetical protein